MVDIKKLSKCFQEVKRLTGDLISDDQINEILNEAKIKINEGKFDQAQIKTDKILAQEVINKFEYEQAVKKRNLADNNRKAIETYQKIVDAIDLSEGRINAVEGVSAILVGMQKFSKITRDSIGARQQALEEMEITRLVKAINDIGDGAWDNLSSGKMDLEIDMEMRGIDTGLKEAAAIAKVLKTTQADLRKQLNDLGANIGELDDWITRMTHNTEKIRNRKTKYYF